MQSLLSREQSNSILSFRTAFFKLSYESIMKKLVSYLALIAAITMAVAAPTSAFAGDDEPVQGPASDSGVGKSGK